MSDIADVLARNAPPEPCKQYEYGHVHAVTHDDITHLLAIVSGVVAKEREWRTGNTESQVWEAATNACADELLALLKGDGDEPRVCSNCKKLSVKTYWELYCNCDSEETETSDASS